MPDGEKIQLEIVTPEGVAVREEVDEVEAPGILGYFGVLPRHTPFLSQLKIGNLRYRIGNRNHYVAVTWGFAEVLPHKVTVLVQTAERATLAALEPAHRRAQQGAAGGGGQRAGMSRAPAPAGAAAVAASRRGALGTAPPAWTCSNP